MPIFPTANKNLPMTQPFDVVILGCGYTGRAVAERARAAGLTVCGTVRSKARAEVLRAAGIEVVREDALDADIVRPLVGPESHVVVAFPPDDTTERAIMPALQQTAAVTFISSTGVYGATTGRIDDDTPIPTERSASTEAYLAAEELFREIGGTTLRCPAIYGADRGLHLRVVSGQHRIPGDGSRATSRIHVADLAALILAARSVRGETFVVGDLEPGPQAETACWLAEAYGAPMPPSVPLESVHETLRGDRRIDPSRALHVLGVSLAYPSYKNGMNPAECAGKVPRRS